MEIPPNNETVTSRSKAGNTPEIELSLFKKSGDAFRGLKLSLYFVQLIILFVIWYRINNYMIFRHYLWKEISRKWQDGQIFGTIFLGACAIFITSVFHLLLFHIAGGQKNSIHFRISLLSFVIPSLIVFGAVILFIINFFGLLFGGPIH